MLLYYDMMYLCREPTSCTMLCLDVCPWVCPCAAAVVWYIYTMVLWREPRPSRKQSIYHKKCSYLFFCCYLLLIVWSPSRKQSIYRKFARKKRLPTAAAGRYTYQTIYSIAHISKKFQYLTLSYYIMAKKCPRSKKFFQKNQKKLLTTIFDCDTI